MSEAPNDIVAIDRLKVLAKHLITKALSISSEASTQETAGNYTNPLQDHLDHTLDCLKPAPVDAASVRTRNDQIAKLDELIIRPSIDGESKFNKYDQLSKAITSQDILETRLLATEILVLEGLKQGLQDNTIDLNTREDRQAFYTKALATVNARLKDFIPESTPSLETLIAGVTPGHQAPPETTKTETFLGAYCSDLNLLGEQGHSTGR